MGIVIALLFSSVLIPVIVNGTNPVNVGNSDEAAEHILSLIPLIDKKIR